MKFWQVVVSTTVLTITTNVNAALVGRLAATDGGTDYQAYYDTEADLTWLTESSEGFLRYNWSGANTWLADLNVAGIEGWRLPKTDTSCLGVNCTGSELGNLFYNVLGGTEFTSLESTHNDNYDLFSGIKNSTYLTSPQYSSDINWIFDMNSGRQLASGSPVAYYVWAVHDGDIGTTVVPVPAAVWLFGSGLVCLMGLAQRKQHKS